MRNGTAGVRLSEKRYTFLERFKNITIFIAKFTVTCEDTFLGGAGIIGDEQEGCGIAAIVYIVSRYRIDALSSSPRSPPPRPPAENVCSRRKEPRPR